MKIRDIIREDPLQSNPLHADIPTDQDHVKSPYGGHYKPRGGFTMDKVQKHLKTQASKSSRTDFSNLYDNKGQSALAREIRKFSSPEEFADHLFWHGTGGYISGGLRAGGSIPQRDRRGYGGGYGDDYHVISVSKSKNVASNFTGDSRHGTVHPVIIMKGSKIVSMPKLSDANELDDYLPELWNRHIDAVRIGDWSRSHSEQELCIVNPRCAIIGQGDGFAVFQKKTIHESNIRRACQNLGAC